MAPLYLYNGKLLVKNNVLATSANCCCSCLLHECSGSECQGGWDSLPGPYRLNITFPGVGTLDLLGPLDLGGLCDYGKLLPSCYYGSALPDLWVRKNAVRYDDENLQFCIEYSQAVDRTDFWKTVVPSNNVWHELILIESGPPFPGDFWYSLKEFQQPYCYGVCGSVNLTAGPDNATGITVNSFEILCDDGVVGCCIGDDAYATMVLSSECTGHSSFIPDMYGCPECGGACCLPDGTCQNETTKYQCETILGGTWHSGETCTQQGCCCENGNCGWIVKDTDHDLVLHSGPVNPGVGDLDLVLTNLPSEWIPWGYYYKTFNAALIFTCGGEEVKTLQTWSVNITNCGTGAERYPVTNMNNDWTYECVGEPCSKVYNLSAGGLTRNNTVNTFDGGSSKSVVDHTYEYSNIFNWVGGSWDKNLPDNTTNVTINAACLHDSTQAAVCKDLTISGNFKFGISITSNGRVLVESNAHVIDEKYNTACTSRGHITCSGAGDVSTLVGYQYNGAVIFNSLSILSGTVTYSGSHNVAVTFGDGAYISDNGTITGGDHIFFRGANVAKFNDPLSLDVPTPTYNGKWIFVGASENRGGLIVTPQYVEFYSLSLGSYARNTSGIEGGRITTVNFPVKFYGASNGKECQDFSRLSPDGIVTHDAEFYSYGGVDGYNAGKVEGDADFYGSSYNAECANDIDGQATFWNTSCNRDIITGDPIFNDNSSNGCPGWLSNTTVKIIGNPTFNDTAHNISKIEGNPIFNEDSYNDTSGVITGDPTFNNNAYSTGTINGNPIFGAIMATNGEVAYNNGTITGNSTFRNFAENRVNGVINGNCVFREFASNRGTINLPANGTCVFSEQADSFRGATNYGGTITGDGTTSVTFNSNVPSPPRGNGVAGLSSTSTVTAGTVTFNDAINAEAGIVNADSIVFNGNGTGNDGTVNGGNITFNNYSRNRGLITVTTLCTFNNNATNEYAAIAGTTLITGNCAFNGGRNYGKIDGDCTFTLGALAESSNNPNTTGLGSFITGNCTFDASTNSGRIDGNVVFSANSKNRGSYALINLPSNGSCVFNNSSHEDNAVISGDDATETVTFNGTSVCDSSVYAATTLNGTSTNSTNGRIYPGIGAGNITLNSGTTNNGEMGVNGNATVTLNSATNNNKIVALNSNNTCIFNNSTNSATGNIGLNLGGPTTVPFTTMSFTNNSSNYGTVTGDADFVNSCNSGTVTGTITCGGGACSPGDPPTC